MAISSEDLLVNDGGAKLIGVGKKFIWDDQNHHVPIHDVTALPSHGTLEWDGSHYIYTPNPDFYGEDSFNYIVNNNGTYLNGTVNITVDPVNDPLIIEFEDVYIFTGETKEIDISQYVYDPEGEYFYISDVSTNSPSPGNPYIPGAPYGYVYQSRTSIST